MAFGKSQVIANEILMDEAAEQQWRDLERNQLSPGPLRGILEAAANNPIGLHILARRIVNGESYNQAVESVATVTNRRISPGAARKRVCLLRTTLRDALS